MHPILWCAHHQRVKLKWKDEETINILNQHRSGTVTQSLRVGQNVSRGSLADNAVNAKGLEASALGHFQTISSAR